MSNNQKPLETTTIGAFPKPDYVPVRDWFDAAREQGGMNTAQTTLDYTTDSETNKDGHEALFIRAAKEVIDIQLRAGVTIPTDGEVRRENYIHYHCRHLDGLILIGWNTGSCGTGPMKPTCRPFAVRSAIRVRVTVRMTGGPAKALVRNL